jgi:hypothetical protein
VSKEDKNMRNKPQMTIKGTVDVHQLEDHFALTQTRFVHEKNDAWSQVIITNHLFGITHIIENAKNDEFTVLKSVKCEGDYLGYSYEEKLYVMVPNWLDVNDTDRLERAIVNTFAYDSCRCGDGDCCGMTPTYVDTSTIRYNKKTGLVSFRRGGSQHV